MWRALGRRLRLLLHRREVAQAAAEYQRLTGHDPGERRPYADAGTFRSQVDRLFALGNATETGELRAVAQAAVSACLTNRFYRSADFLADLLSLLESTT